MNSKTQIGKVIFPSICSVEINENILDMSNTATITIPRNISKLDFGNGNILKFISVKDKVIVELGYNGQLSKQFTGYVREIESDFPLKIYCEDESFLLRQNSFIKSYKSATLFQILSDIIPKDITWECPEVNIGKYQIDKASAYEVLNDLIKRYGLYSRLNEGHLKVGLAYDFSNKSHVHSYKIGYNVKTNNLKYKRKEDFKIRFKATATSPNGKKEHVIVGSLESNASERTLNFVGPMTKDQLKEKARAIMAKLVYDGYTGTITGFGYPETHAGDSIEITDKFDPDRGGIYLIEQVNIRYSEDEGYKRENTLSYKLNSV